MLHKLVRIPVAAFSSVLIGVLSFNDQKTTRLKLIFVVFFNSEILFFFQSKVNPMTAHLQ